MSRTRGNHKRTIKENAGLFTVLKENPIIISLPKKTEVFSIIPRNTLRPSHISEFRKKAKDLLYL